jgi:hypothetical protein
MAVIIKTSINLNAIPKDKIIEGKKGKYLPIVITINDETDQFGNHGPVTVDQSVEERESKAGKVYLGNVKVVWTNGQLPDINKEDGASRRYASKPVAAKVAEDDLPF